MSRQRKRRLLIAVCVVIPLVVLAVVVVTQVGYPADGRLDVRVLGQSQYYVGSKAVLRVSAVDYGTNEGLPEVDTTIVLEDNRTRRSWTLHKGTTDAGGVLEAPIQIPDIPEGAYQVTVRAIERGVLPA